jgi:hypothetical protein
VRDWLIAARDRCREHLAIVEQKVASLASESEDLQRAFGSESDTRGSSIATVAELTRY